MLAAIQEGQDQVNNTLNDIFASYKSRKKTSLEKDRRYQGKFSFPLISIYLLSLIADINLENQINIWCLICLSLSFLKNKKQIKIVCNISLLYFSIKFAINKIYRDEECKMEMMNSCSVVIPFKYLVLNLSSPKDWIDC